MIFISCGHATPAPGKLKLPARDGALRSMRKVGAERFRQTPSSDRPVGYGCSSPDVSARVLPPPPMKPVVSTRAGPEITFLERRWDERRAWSRNRRPSPSGRSRRCADVGVADLSARDWLAITQRAFKEMLNDNMTMIASALAYSTSSRSRPSCSRSSACSRWSRAPARSTPDAHLGHVMPAQATQPAAGEPASGSTSKPSAGLAMTVVGFVLAFWSMTGAMTSYMTALNLAYDRKDGRSFVRKRVTALAMVVCIGVAFLLVAGLLIFGPTIEKHLGNALGIQLASSRTSGGPRNGRSWSAACSRRSRRCSGSARTSSIRAGASSPSAAPSPSRSGSSPRARSRSTPPGSARTTRPGAPSPR